jgi:hypothetical protein
MRELKCRDAARAASLYIFTSSICDSLLDHLTVLLSALGVVAASHSDPDRIDCVDNFFIS